MITNIDENFGKLRAKLDELGIAEDTILIFMTDNGTATGVELDENGFPFEGPGSFNAGMRGKKGSPYEGGHHVPFIMRYPNGGASGGRDIDALTSYVDLMPTLLHLCEEDLPDGRTFHGKSLVPIMKEAPGDEWNDRIIVSDTQRIARPMKWRKSSIMKNRWRLVNGDELYDLSHDSGQRNNIAGQHPDVVQELRVGYDAWWNIFSEQFDRDIPIALGQNGEPVKITTHDIRNEACNAVWNHRQVRMGVVCSGFWEVDVRTEGNYEIELRRWPEEAGYAAAAGIDGDDVEWRKDAIKDSDATHYTGGVALRIGWAQMTIGGKTYQTEIGEDDTGATFQVALRRGPDRLFASFHDKVERMIAPYYVYVRKQ